MRRQRSLFPDDADAGLELTPLIDVVFILLIFLLVTTSFTRESGLEVNRPGALSATSQENGGLLVGLRADGAAWMEGRRVPMEALRSLLERRHAERPQAGLVIVADRDAPTGALVRVMDQARLAGISDVSVAADAEGASP